MNPGIKRRWVEALRSGDYRQGTGQLSRDDKFCCLGVLCDVAVKSGVTVSTKTDDRSTGYDNSFVFLPPRVQEWAGLPENDPNIAVANTWLSSLNDDGASFAEIADLIDEHL
ncbi:hypothetical protein [Amycolatopsis kentuckyensis]|uniref:hypothetical protein n=1 Tax=Amycolatopsis kentuckyensis TaxID=218823 RepID=UPI000A38AAC3|nr:hypothetical protein [Amycolatopsis kentuckyensis]